MSEFTEHLPVEDPPWEPDDFGRSPSVPREQGTALPSVPLGPPDQDTETWCAEHANVRTSCNCPNGPDPDTIHRGQLRMAYRLAKSHAERLMYVKGLGWHVWDGKRWATDEKDAAKTAVYDLLRKSWEEAFKDKDLEADVRKCESAAGIDGVLGLASALPALRAAVSELDADPFLFNCPNGTLDLRDRQLRKHRPSDRITRVTRGAYAPGVRGRGWDGFLSGVLPKDDVRAYLQRVIGQGVYGGVRAQLFPVLTGVGANGKGVAYGAITHALGDYATIIKPEVLMAADRGSTDPELMKLLGARLAVGSETEEGRQLDAATMKRLTGGDELTARHLYQDPVRWAPTHQLIYVTNHLPKVRGNDPAVWRRMRIVPFDVVIPEADRDEKLGDQLEFEADAITTWAIEGWFDYEDRDGMDEPESVLVATDKYQTESDAVKRFIQDACVTNSQALGRTRQMHTAWIEWAERNDVEALKETPFAKELDRLGYPATRTAAGMVRNGIGLRAEDTENDGEM